MKNQSDEFQDFVRKYEAFEKETVDDIDLPLLVVPLFNLEFQPWVLGPPGLRGGLKPKVLRDIKKPSSVFQTLL